MLQARHTAGARSGRTHKSLCLGLLSCLRHQARSQPQCPDCIWGLNPIRLVCPRIQTMISLPAQAAPVLQARHTAGARSAYRLFCALHSPAQADADRSSAIAAALRGGQVRPMQQLAWNRAWVSAI